MSRWTPTHTAQRGQIKHFYVKRLLFLDCQVRTHRFYRYKMHFVSSSSHGATVCHSLEANWPSQTLVDNFILIGIHRFRLRCLFAFTPLCFLTASTAESDQPLCVRAVRLVQKDWSGITQHIWQLLFGVCLLDISAVSCAVCSLQIYTQLCDNICSSPSLRLSPSMQLIQVRVE